MEVNGKSTNKIKVLFILDIDNVFLLWESYETNKYTVYKMQNCFNVKAGCTYSKRCYWKG
jgi:hypothetical protein